MLLQKRNVLVENLLLKVLRTRGNNDAFSGQDGRDQVGRPGQQLQPRGEKKLFAVSVRAGEDIRTYCFFLEYGREPSRQAKAPR